MGEGLKRVAKRHGGLTVRQGDHEAKHVPVGSDGKDKQLISRHTRAGWQYDGKDEAGEFHLFTREAKSKETKTVRA